MSTCTRPRCKAAAVVVYSAPTAPQGWSGPLCGLHYGQLAERLDRTACIRYRPHRWARYFEHRWNRLRAPRLTSAGCAESVLPCG